VSVTQKELAERLKAARENAGLTQQEVAEAIGVGRTAVVQIEAGKRAVTSLELAEMAQLYGRGISEFIEEKPFEEDPLVALFRATPGYTEDRELRRHLLACVDLCREAANLERLLSLGSPQLSTVNYNLEAPTGRWEAISQGRRLAEQEHNRLDLGVSPIWEIAEIIAQQGVRVAEYKMPDEISGLFFHGSGVGFAIVVNWCHHRNRRLFSYAHEYCHLLADRDRSGGVSHAGNRQELSEVRANAFAAHFLMPEEGVRAFLRSIGKGESSRQRLEVYDVWDHQVAAQKRTPTGSQELRLHDVVSLAHHFGVSYEAALYHLKNLKVLREDSFEYLMGYKDAANSMARALRVAAWEEDIHWSLAEHVLFLGFEAYRREEISRGKLMELAEKAEVSREDVEAALSESDPGRGPVEAMVPEE
jgi:Zn-dependent peptidase ImmA (M78 family)/DNA-binding XRE family transcriptional regulator